MGTSCRNGKMGFMGASCQNGLIVHPAATVSMIERGLAARPGASPADPFAGPQSQPIRAWCTARAEGRAGLRRAAGSDVFPETARIADNPI